MCCVSEHVAFIHVSFVDAGICKGNSLREVHDVTKAREVPARGKHLAHT